jgi:hypothetical protein
MLISNSIMQFKISLLDISPSIWRRIQVPYKYSFWDLHVAIQDSMGWLDCHLHKFSFRGRNKAEEIEIGIPDDEMFDEMIDKVTLPGWDIGIYEYFTKPGDKSIYEYDFGDCWEHDIILEDILNKEIKIKYPRCISGERACPPEDCGSVPGYYHLLEILSDTKHKEYKDIIGWLKGHLKNYYPYNPDMFDPELVKFDNPKKRLREAFNNS